MSIKFGIKAAAIFLLLSLGPLLLAVSDTPAADALGTAGFGYVRGLKGEYFDNGDFRYAAVVESARPNASNPWTTGNGLCPQHLNTGAARMEDGKEAMLSNRYTLNAIRLRDFAMSTYGSPPISDAIVKFRFMTRLSNATICPSQVPGGGAAVPIELRVHFRGVNYLVGSFTSNALNDYVWVTLSLCENTRTTTSGSITLNATDPTWTSCAVKPLTWEELNAKNPVLSGQNDNKGITLEILVGGAGTDAAWNWVLWDVGKIEVITSPTARGARVDTLVDFGNPTPTYTMDWRAAGGPSDILLNRSSLTNVANTGTGAQSGCAGTLANAVDLNNVGTAYTCGNVAGYWQETWAAAQYVNKVKIQWNTQIGSNLGNPLYLQWSPDTANWYNLQTIYRIPISGETRSEQTYTFPTIATRGFRISNNAVADGFSFWEFHAYPEEYNYFEARWLGEVNFLSTGAQHLCTVSDDGSRLWIDESLVPGTDSWAYQGPTVHGGYTPSLEAGWHKVRMEYFEWTGGAAARLGECNATCAAPADCTAIPTDRLRASWEGPSNFTFLNGWVGNFWSNVANPKAVGTGTYRGYELESIINFNWGQGAPCPNKVSLSGDSWGVRYTGYLRAEYAGTYSICVNAIGGVRLDIGGDNDTDLGMWNYPNEGRKCINRALPQGETFVILEYFDGATASSNAKLQLMWTPNSPEYISALDLSVVNDYYLGVDANTRLLFHFNENGGAVANDSAGAANNGTIAGGIWKNTDLMATLWDGTKIYPNYPKLYFDGAGGDGITIPYAAGWELNIPGPITIEAWVKFVGNCIPSTAGYWPTIVHKEIGGVRNYGFYLGCPAAGGNPFIHYSYANATTTSTLCGTVTPLVNIADGWHHIAVASYPGNYERFYVDGAMIQYFNFRTSPKGDPCAWPDQAAVGTENLVVGDQGFVGSLDEVRVTAADLSSDGTISPTRGQGFVPPATNHYTYRYFDPSKRYTFSNVINECLEFDEYLMATNPEFLGGFDADMSVTGVLRSTGWVDQNGLSVHPSTNLSAYAKGKWYHRCFAVPAANTEIMSNPIIASENEVSGLYDIMLDNIKITQNCTIGAGTCTPGVALYTFYDTGAPLQVTKHADTIPPEIYAAVSEYPQGVTVLPGHYLYTNGLRRFVYNSDYGAYPAGAQEPFFAKMVCQGIDWVVNHNWGTSAPEYFANALQTGNAMDVVSDCAGKTRANNWAIRWEGQIYTSGGAGNSYTFRITVNQVGKLTIDNTIVISNCGTLGTDASTQCTGSITLTTGWHYLDLDLIKEGPASQNAAATLEMMPGGGSYKTQAEMRNVLAMRQYIPGATLTWGGSGPGYENSNVVNVFADFMDQLGKIFAGMGCSCSTVFDGSAAADAQTLDALRNLRDVFLAQSRIGEVYTWLYYRISSPISRALEAYPFLKRAARTVLNPFVQLGKLLRSEVRGPGRAAKSQDNLDAGIPAERPIR